MIVGVMARAEERQLCPSPTKIAMTPETKSPPCIDALRGGPGLRNAFLVCGYVGVALACGLTNILVIYRGLSLWVMLAIVPLAILIFLALVMATKIVVGEERIVNYHHEIAVVAGTALFLRFVHQPVLPYLDITILGIGLFLACGRIGCLLVGCCHGRPFRWGVRYGAEHADAGFTPYYVGIPLFPVQAAESLWALGVVVAGTLMVVRGDAPGSVLTMYIIVYGFGRFCFEFLRGDPERPYLLGFSEAQWTSIVLMSAIVYEEAIRVLPLARWQVAITVSVVVIMIGVATHRHLRCTPIHLLFRPQHVKEIAEAISFAAAAPAQTGVAFHEGSQIRVGTTSLGLQISRSLIPRRGLPVSHYAMSCRHRTMTPDFAWAVANLICLLRHSHRDPELVLGSGGVYHLFVAPNSAHSNISRPPVLL